MVYHWFRYHPPFLPPCFLSPSALSKIMPTQNTLIAIYLREVSYDPIEFYWSFLLYVKLNRNLNFKKIIFPTVLVCNEFCGGILEKKDVAGWESRHDRPTYYLPDLCHLGNLPITPTVHLSILPFPVRLTPPQPFPCCKTINQNKANFLKKIKI
jgi:hypothetical protein